MDFPLPLRQHSLKQRESETLRVSEIFYSLQGETSRVGLPTVFIRLTGCPLRCGYCDTAYAFTGGENISIMDVLAKVSEYAPRYVTVTGGEPLAQKACLTLLTSLCDAGYSVSIETSGALDISGIDKRVSKIVDIKTPDSGEVTKNRWANLDYLTPQDELKFVLCSEQDYRWAVDIFYERQLDQLCPVLFSPAFGQLDPALLASWILKDRLPVRLQLQLHKILWGEVAGR
ncbi:MAG TPA: 7-carboxy-7-deazaguanine synthase QueE [Nitrosomonas nitrosa]|uniref:7-carboxy-7-deazaguanine synthase n=1 Tax=Nitrosomonas nitrosa TaxID=52442 RepID=A0A1I4S456_9PROT|nr:7-carboxy-7-deazaguanine synthase QueE [Nitrosomonas nitrosa]MCO6434354.1 7-carboxy-7-deazaguanine synthase QueE [Nitrosomonas nitrosa]PTQ94426.1 7-carboxy-7-deazaguanine synthase [Nitrosomonas nitrosa]SFM59282.1 7-carboxy-7-deazaguanine synthase [Nitrosomonas nitrosa]HBZ30485.1 7-carboxy-7-deazaguanine synthase QueE [Nitrosomonas nitrosa]HNP50377.1 7-carboxy-7-deazaguanine synthase QueE [Nitrosomonas nitrosa]